jgi:hypothetical protein
MIQLEKGVQKIGPDVKAIAQRAGLSKEDVMKIANDADAERARNKARLGSRDTLRGSAQ